LILCLPLIDGPEIKALQGVTNRLSRFASKDSFCGLRVDKSMGVVGNDRAI
jgi:hypothetical protein